MTYLRFMRSLIICSSLLFTSCSTIHDFFWPSEAAQYQSPTRVERKERAISSSFEWAVQSYEAGSYKDAIRQFTALKKAGADINGYEMIPFYLGMSYSKRNESAKARKELEAYLQSQPKNRESVEARMALLLIYEKSQQWDQAVALAAETDKLQVFQDNRALLKLIWARALREKGELLGARAAIKDANLYLENTSEDSLEGKDLWGRYHYVQVLTKIQECRDYTAKTVGKKKIFPTWLESEENCWKQAYENGLETFRQDNAWAQPTLDALSGGLDNFGNKIKLYGNELKNLAAKRTLQKLARQTLYQTMEALDRDLKVFKERSLKSQSLEQIRKKIDHLLVTI